MTQRRRRSTQIEPLEERLSEQAERLRKEARGTPPGIDRERLMRKVRQIETAVQMSDWLRPLELQPPK
jgi:hypothetical protein